MTSYGIINDYFEWLFNIVCGERFGPHISYRKLLMRLHDIEFRYSIPNDKNRAENGKNLRYRFAVSEYRDYDEDVILDILNGPCSVLEMMVALSIKCEEDIMDNPAMGDRTGQWFWGMIRNLGLLGMSDDKFDRNRVDEIIDIFLDRGYEPNGKGGLFTVKNTDIDLRNHEIWYQLCHYLETIV